MTVVPDHVPVLVVGGGPSGLAAAIELGRRGIDVLVVETRTALDPLRPRAKTTSVRTMEHLRRWGIADRLRAAAPLPVEHAQDVVFVTGLFGHEITRFPNAFGLWTTRQDIAAEAGQQGAPGRARPTGPAAPGRGGAAGGRRRAADGDPPGRVAGDFRRRWCRRGP